MVRVAKYVWRWSYFGVQVGAENVRRWLESCTTDAVFGCNKHFEAHSNISVKDRSWFFLQASVLKPGKYPGLSGDRTVQFFAVLRTWYFRGAGRVILTLVSLIRRGSTVDSQQSPFTAAPSRECFFPRRRRASNKRGSHISILSSLAALLARARRSCSASRATAGGRSLPVAAPLKPPTTRPPSPQRDIEGGVFVD